MKILRIVLVHLILFGLIILLSFGSLYVYMTHPEAQKIMLEIKKDMDLSYMIKISFFNFGIFVVIIYSFYFLIFNLLFKKKPTLLNIFKLTGVLLLLLGLNSLVSVISGSAFKVSSLPGALMFIVVFGGIGLGGRAIIEYFKTKEKEKELERKNLKIELDMLRSQINPHFLFNTLNNIDALIRKDPERASELLIKLSQEMRYMLYDSNTDKVSLGSEVEFIKDYITLQKLRIKNPDVIQLKLEGDFENIMLPPMLLIPFIENVFKYCNKFDVEKAIIIRIAVKGNELIFESNNCYDPENKSSNTRTGGIGLEVVEKRLDLLYPDKHEFNISKTDCQFIVSLKIQLDGR